MKFENMKIQSSEISAKGVVSAPDRLSGTAAENKAVFDRLVKDVVVEKFNSFVDLVREEIESIEVPPEGAPGYTPVKGTDYWTEADKAEINASVKEATLETLRAEDLAEINEALEDLDASKLSMELLWENASPASSFAKQKVSLDLSPYSMVEVNYQQGTGSSSNPVLIGTIKYYVGIPNVQRHNILPPTNITSSTGHARRDVTIPDATGIQFDDCVNVVSNAAYDNTRLIPYKIYGIKGGAV